MPITMMVRIAATMPWWPETGPRPSARQVQPAASRLNVSKLRISAPKIQLRTIKTRKATWVADRVVNDCEIVSSVRISINDTNLIEERQLQTSRARVLNVAHYSLATLRAHLSPIHSQ